MSSDGRTPLLLLTLSIAAVGIQALMLSPLLTDIAAGLGTQAKEIGFAASAYGVGVASAALLAAPQLGRWPKRAAPSPKSCCGSCGLLSPQSPA